jgi:hypothetical protein
VRRAQSRSSRPSGDAVSTVGCRPDRRLPRSFSGARWRAGVSLGRHLGLFTDHVKVDAVYGISEEPMSAEEWKKHFVKAG